MPVDLDRNGIFETTQEIKRMRNAFNGLVLEGLIEMIDYPELGLANFMGEAFRPVMDQALWKSFKAGWKSGRASS